MRVEGRRDALVEVLVVDANLDVRFEMFREEHHGNIDIL